MYAGLPGHSFGTGKLQFVTLLAMPFAPVEPCHQVMPKLPNCNLESLT